MLSLALFVTHFFVLYCWKIPWLALSACFTPLISYRPTQTYYTSTLWCHDLISTIYSQLVYISTLSDLMEVLLIVLETVKAVVRCLNHYTGDREFKGQWLPWFNISYFIDASVQLKIKICTVHFLCFLFEWYQLKHLQCCSFCFSGCFPPSGSPTSIPTPSTYTPHHQQQQPLLQPQTSFLIQQLIFPSLFLCHRLLVSDEEILCPQTKTVH